MMGYGPYPLHLMREEELLNVQNKILNFHFMLVQHMLYGT